MNFAGYDQRITEICKRHKVDKLSVFGSSTTERFNKDSDIDFLVTFLEKRVEGSFDRYFSLKEDLEELFHREVDLVCEKQIKNPYFRNRAMETKQVLYGS